VLDIIEINKKYQSDKGGKHPYLEKYYSNLFAPIRNNNLNFLEIGVYHGASLKLWRDYFPNANLHGVDFKNRKNYFDNLDRITLHQGKSDQSSTYRNSLLTVPVPQISTNSASSILAV